MNAPTRSVYERLHRAIELLANIGIIVVAELGRAVLVKQLMSARSCSRRLHAAQSPPLLGD